MTCPLVCFRLGRYSFMDHYGGVYWTVLLDIDQHIPNRVPPEVSSGSTAKIMTKLSNKDFKLEVLKVF